MKSKWLNASIDIASLVFLRIAFGLIVTWEMLRYLLKGWVYETYYLPKFLFKFMFFEWVHPWPYPGLMVHFGLVAIAGLFVAAGFYYFFAAWFTFLSLGYFFLLEQAQYLNHAYLIVIISFLMAIVPANEAFSVDAWRKPDFARQWTPRWTLFIFQLQLFIVYFYGAIAKFEGDWLRGQPLLIWLEALSGRGTVPEFMANEAVALFMAYSGLLIDLLIVPLLIWRRTRLWAFLGGLCFHISNHFIFSIGVFPFFMLAFSTVYFDPSWPRRIFLKNDLESEVADQGRGKSLKKVKTTWKLGFGFMAIFFLVQLSLPLRHHFYPGNPSWTDEGHWFAWRMMLRAKKGQADFMVVDLNERPRKVHPRLYLTNWQAKKMAARPDMILQFARFLGKEHANNKNESARVYARATVQLNDHPPQEIIDKTVNLASTDRTLRHYDWVYPLAP